MIMMAMRWWMRGIVMVLSIHVTGMFWYFGIATVMMTIGSCGCGGDDGHATVRW